jgi:outer membrane protein W
VSSVSGRSCKLALAAGVLFAMTTVSAEDVEKKLRLAISIGGFDGSDNAHSPSANIRTVLDENENFLLTISDPRNDAGAISDFGLEPQYVGTFSASYAFNPYWYIEGSVGYRRGDVGNVEVQAQFQGVEPTGVENFAFRIFNLKGGTLSQIPLQLTGGIRFRPKAALNPYLCAGVGYTLNGFDPSNDLNDLSTAMNNAAGSFAPVNIFGAGFEAAGPTTELTGITVEAPDAPEWHLGAGVEVTFKKHWVVFADARYFSYSNRFAFHMNGDSTQLGISVPADTVKVTDPTFAGPFGAYLIPNGGLIDGGSLVPLPGAPPDTNCATEPIACSFAGPPDGVLDPGYYYVHAGSVRYDGVTLQFGVKFTF